MLLTDFFDWVEEHEELEGVAIDAGSKELTVRHKTSGLMTALPADAIAATDDKELLLSVFRGEREPQVIFHITRVIGYYSRVENWNASKRGELVDRHAGNYALPTA